MLFMVNEKVRFGGLLVCLKTCERWTTNSCDKQFIFFRWYFNHDLDLNLYSLGLLLILPSLDILGDRSLDRTYLIRYEQDILSGVAHHGNFTWKHHLPPRPTEL